jgi:uncharacterized membrane protein
MSEDEAFRLLHMLSLFIFVAGVGATMLPLYRSWNNDEINTQVHAIQEAGRNQAGVLLPGMILTGISGVFWALRSDHVDPIQTGWLFTVEVLYLIALFICLPAMAASLRRARFLALQSQKSGEISDELRETIADRGPIVFGTLMLLLIVLMTALAVTKPY